MKNKKKQHTNKFTLILLICALVLGALLAVSQLKPKSGAAGDAESDDLDIEESSAEVTEAVTTEQITEVLTETTTAETAAVTTTVEPTSETTTTNGIKVCIDAGHQAHQMTDKEPNGPGSSVMKQKVTSGTTGVATGKEEYEVNLEVSLQLRDELVKRGYEVIMVRETNDVTLSNVERAQIANEAEADIFIRIHCNGIDNSSVAGVMCYMPSASNPYLTDEVISESIRLSECLIENQCAITGQQNRGLLVGDDMTGINWAQMPVSIVEMGFMSNAEEDQFMASANGQYLIVQGLANGIDEFVKGMKP